MPIASYVAALSRRLGSRGPSVTSSGGGVYPVTFPTTLLRIRVELLLGGTWTDISSYVQYEAGISIERGRDASQRRARISQCSFQLRNDSRRFSPRNVTGPYFGMLRQNTPVRVYVNPGSGDSLRFSGRVPSWEPVLRGHPNDRPVSVTAYGRRNQSETGEESLASAQYRYLSTSGALQYRPMEGTGEGMVTGPAGSGDLPDLATGGVWSDFPGGASNASWRIEVDAKFGLDAGTADFAPIIRWNTGGTIGEWKLSADVVQAQLTYTVQATGAQTILDTGLDVYDGIWHHWQVDATQNGGNIDLVIRADGVSVYSTSLAQTLGSSGSGWCRTTTPQPAPSACRPSGTSRSTARSHRRRRPTTRSTHGRVRPRLSVSPGSARRRAHRTPSASSSPMVSSWARRDADADNTARRV
jgi:hypothetical protein